MKKSLIVISLLIGLSVKAQFYYNPYQQQQANKQAYERGRQMMQQQMDSYNNNPANATAITGQALQQIALNVYEEESVYENAVNKIEHVAENLGFSNAWYWLGVFNECGLGTSKSLSYAKTCYRNAGNHRNAKKRLQMLNNGAVLFKRRYVTNYITEMIVANTIPQQIPLKSASQCPNCLGTGYDLTPYFHDLSSHNGYHHYKRTSCPICGASSEHWHYRCSSSH